jgi:hypothetical protein
MKLSYNDRQHAYWLDGERCKGVSTIAKVPDDTYNLTQWGKRMVALGMSIDATRDGDLAERALAHHDDRDALNGVAEDALRAAKAHEAAARGTAIHRVLERHDLGETIIDTPHSRALRAAYDKALTAAGLSVVPEYVERIVVHQKPLLVAGRFDRIFKRKRDGKFVIGDIKSGSNAVKYPQSTSVQLAMYANAPLLAGHIPGSGGETEEFEKMPEKIDLKRAYIVHAPDPDHVEVVEIDIAGGYDVYKKAIVPILAWRARKDLIKPIGITSVLDLEAPADLERVEWIFARLRIIREFTDASAREMTAALWPQGVPTAKRVTAGDGVWSENDVDLLDEMLATVEKQWSTPFAELDPARKDQKAA